MVTIATTEAPAAYHAAETPVERRARHVRNLEELAEIGLETARDIRAEIRCETEAACAGRPQPDAIGRDRLCLGLARVSRSVRLSYAMIERLDRAEAKAASGKGAAPADPALADPAPEESKSGGMIWMDGRLIKLPPLSAYSAAQMAKGKERSVAERLCAQESRRAEARKQIVEDTVEASINTEARESGTETEIQDRCERLYARIDELWASDAAYDFLNYPIVEMAQRICKDLGVTFEPERWTNEPWAVADAKEPHEMAAFLAAADPRRLVMRCANGRVFLRGQAPPPNIVLPKVDPPPGG